MVLWPLLSVVADEGHVAGSADEVCSFGDVVVFEGPVGEGVDGVDEVKLPDDVGPAELVAYGAAHVFVEPGAEEGSDVGRLCVVDEEGHFVDGGRVSFGQAVRSVARDLRLDFLGVGEALGDDDGSFFVDGARCGFRVLDGHEGFVFVDEELLDHRARSLPQHEPRVDRHDVVGSGEKAVAQHLWHARCPSQIVES